MNPEEESRINEFVEIFMEQDFFNAIYYCSTWKGTNERYFREKEPADFVIYTLERIIEGKRKVYLDNYKTFKGSVYYHLRNEMLTYFNCGNDTIEESPHYINVNDSNIVAYDDNVNYENNNNNYESDTLTLIECNDLKEQIFNLFDEDKELEEILVLQGYLDGKKREEIAEDLGITVNEVTNIKKRVVRKIIKSGINI